MTKSELIQRLLLRNSHLNQREIERVIATIFSEISFALADGDRVELRGFGSFSIKTRAERIGRNPRTGEAVIVLRKFAPFFKAGKALRHRINGKT